MRIRASILILGLIAASCAAPSSDRVGNTDQPSPTTSPSPTTTIEPREQEPNPSFEPAPAVLVSNGDVELALDPWTACWTVSCYDGAPPDEPRDIGVGDELIIEFPAEGWTFQATARTGPGDCGRRQTEDLAPIDSTRHRLTPIGPAGQHIIEVFGHGPGGDVIVTFVWTTTTDGPPPVPMATTSILADHDGLVDSYGVEVSLWNLAHTPDEVSAEATVIAADGSSHSFRLTDRSDACSVGSLYLTAAIDEGLTAAQLGGGKFTYEIEVTMDGLNFTGTGIWPTDEDPECAPCVPLTFDPPLESLEAVSSPAIEARKFDDVWIFSHSPDGGDGALHTGVATINNGCLYVDGAVVVWHVDSIDQATATIEAVQAGQQPTLSIGGGGTSLEEGATSLPAEITDRCPTSAVWFGTP
ncbi:MAG: hypothetical protein HKN07_12740 [Acidimicrobiia bacterium]|nr:hypothetical protein [Acidimicrobiia bacterium]